MRFLWSTALKDLRRQRRDSLALAIWIGIPLVIGTMITLATGGEAGVQPTAHLLVLDEDEGFLSNLLAGSMGQSGELVDIELVETREDGLAGIEEDGASALLIIPEGFSEAVLREDPTRLELYTNPTQRILPGILEEGLSLVVDGTFYVHRVLGEELREIVDGPADDENVFPDLDMARISVSINQAMRRLEKYLFPPVIELDVAVDEEEGEDESVSYSILFLPGILIMALCFVSMGLSEDLWTERERRTLQRVVSTPQSLSSFLAGKLLAGAIVLAGIVLVSLVLGMAYHGVSFARLPLALGWSVACGVALLLGVYLIQLLVSSRRAGAIVTTSLVFPLLMLGGSFFPSEAMPSWMATVGRFTPNGFAGESLKDVLLGRADATAMAAGFLGVAAAIVILLLLCARRIRRLHQGA